MVTWEDILRKDALYEPNPQSPIPIPIHQSLFHSIEKLKLFLFNLKNNNTQNNNERQHRSYRKEEEGEEEE